MKRKAGEERTRTQQKKEGSEKEEKESEREKMVKVVKISAREKAVSRAKPMKALMKVTSRGPATKEVSSTAACSDSAKTPAASERKPKSTQIST